jgi:hypothetical protein
MATGRVVWAEEIGHTIDQRLAPFSRYEEMVLDD